MSRSHAALLSLCLAACGARTGLASPPDPDAGSDAGVPAAAETCDGRDEDLDGRVDEDLPPLTCGDDRCAREAPSCLDGRPQVCPPIVPTEETCNRLDDDCDGRIDETLGFAPLGPPIVIREVDDERSGDCVQCSEVLDFQLVTFGRALHGVWHLFIAGTPDRPNTYVRRLGDDGRPLERSRPLFDAITTRVALAPSHSGRTIASYCARQADGIDYPRSEFLGPDGAPLGIAPERGDADVRCNTETSVLWTGELHVFARHRLTVGLSLETADRDGRSLGVQLVDWPSWATDLPRAFDGTRAYALRVDDWSGLVLVLEIDAFGTPTRYDLPAPFPAPSMDSGVLDEGAVLADERGVLVAFTRYLRTGSGREDVEHEALFHHYDPDARTLTALGRAPLAVSGTPRLERRGADELLLVNVAEGRTFAGDPLVEVQRLSGEGEPLASWVFESPGDRGGIRAVDVRAHLGRVFVAYVRAIVRGQTRVELLELGCEP